MATPGAPITRYLGTQVPVPQVPPYSLQGTATGTAPDYAAQNQALMQQWMENLNALNASADVWANQRQAAATAAQQSYQQQLQAPLNLAPPPLAAIPYAAAQFAATMQGRPEVGQQADQSLIANRAALLQRRTEVLDNLHEQSLEAARQAQQAGDLAASLKFNTKANAYLNQLQEAQQSLRESQGRRETQAAENQRMQWELAFRNWQTQYTQQSNTIQALVAAGGRDPATRARLDALEKIYVAETKPIQDAYAASLLSNNRGKQAELQAQILQKRDDYIGKINTVLGDTTATAPKAVAPADTSATPELPSIRGFQSFLMSGQEQQAMEDRFVAQAFPKDKTKAEILAGLHEKDAQGRQKGDILARQYGFTLYGLEQAVKRSMRGGPAQPALPDSTRAKLRGNIRVPVR